MSSYSGTIVKGVGGFYYVQADDGRAYTLRAQAKLRRARLTPMVGDRVEFLPEAGTEEGWLSAILPRKNALVRPPVSNVDRLVVVCAASTPEPDAALVDRQLAVARAQGIEAMLVVTKIDQGEPSALLNQYRGAGIALAAVSARTGAGLAALKERLVGMAQAFAGQSGAGKSTLINALYGLTLATGSLSEKTEHGRHTTRHCELLSAGGARVFDTPGFSLMELQLMEPIQLRELYPEFTPFEGQCRFAPCTHASEPDCAVLRAVGRGEIDASRHARYVAMLSEMKVRWNQRYG